MSTQTVHAYNLPERVAAYDADMELMHPNRSKMIDVALSILPFQCGHHLTAIDLGVGTGFFTHRFLERFPAAKVVAIDGAVAMIELARARLVPEAHRVRFIMGDFRELRNLTRDTGPIDVVFSSFALHHLNSDEKNAVIGQALERLGPDGWFINADIVRAETAEVERRIQKLRVEGIVNRAAGREDRFADFAATRRVLDELETRDGDQPQTLAIDLDIARRAGLSSVEVLWKEYREVVYGGPAMHVRQASA